jgi:hypothetical protein
MHIFHKWKLVKTELTEDNHFSDFKKVPFTRVYYKCSMCDKTKRQYRDGHWSVEELLTLKK